ncbi:ABC transporter ATP-binding protein [Salinimicrobium oceani]|uniref:ABC transporter ATP-binding protein n=1 Tax=Salinimicrobium oceani TaxID=2722702 RepID=A0ABX1D3E5_9FLAO|nr:ABC transporter ATP-binding protein [Salinimicrobium oceani]NJW53446.1 ABC transporter ATP-binding protein [Salinimicrobium oceani]
MKIIKILIKKHFESFAYFYSYLEYRIFVVVVFSLLIGILDGLGLTMFLPLLQMINDSTEIDPESLGRLGFLVDFIEGIGLNLTIFSVLLFMAFFFLVKGVIQYIGGVYKVNVQQGFIKKLRIKNIRGLNRLAYKYFVTSDIGRIQNTLTGEVNKVSLAFINYFTAFQYGILVFVYMAFAFTIDSQFAILVSIGGVLTNFLYKSLYKNTKSFSRTLTGENSIFQSLIIQNVSNYKYLKATGYLNKYEKKLNKSAEKIEISNKKIGKLEALLEAGREPILIIVVITVIFIQTIYFNSDLGPILISLIFFYRALGYLMQMQVRWNKFLAVSGSLENMALFGEELESNKEVKGPKIFDESIKRMELSKVNFFYNNTHILKNISLDIVRNETVAFVGESGSGKTTIVNILSGLLPIDSGNYKLNGKNIETLNLNNLQTKFGYITQDAVIFNDTIYNNVSFWSENTPNNREKFWKALKQASIYDFVNELPEKENTILGNNGVNLSGGQKQRISIARELYKDIEVLILDEATSALDSETERNIKDNIDNLKGKYTMLIVAHRISTIKNADKIIIMDNGQISNINSFNELINDSSYFRNLVKLQDI